MATQTHLEMYLLLIFHCVAISKVVSVFLIISTQIM